MQGINIYSVICINTILEPDSAFRSYIQAILVFVEDPGSNPCTAMKLLDLGPVTLSFSLFNLTGWKEGRDGAMYTTLSSLVYLAKGGIKLKNK